MVALANAGTISTSVSSLSSFGNVYAFHSSTSLRYTVSGNSLTANLVITAPAGFEVSLTYGYGYTKKVTIAPVGGTITAVPVFARFSPSVTGAGSGSITHESTGSAMQNVSVTGTCIAWSIPANYYSTVNTQRGAALKTVLYTKISASNTIGSYASVWTSYNTTDKQPNGKIWDIYSTTMHTPPAFEYTYSTNQCGNYSIEGDCYNREHSFPKSWFNDAAPMHNDLNHLFASDGKVNGMRNNYPFGTVTNPTYTSGYGGKLGPNTYPGYTGTVFEPIDEYKGDLARGYFYMATRYENLINTWVGSAYGNSGDVLDGTSFPAFDAWHINLLTDWHNLDPVSDKEIKRNNAIYAIQNTRNPYVDSPQFVQRIWGGVIPQQPTISSSTLTVTNNSNTSVTLNWVSGNGQRRIVIVRAGNAVNALPVDTLQYGAGTDLGTAPVTGAGNYVVYNGTGSTVTITNMTAGTMYYYAVIDYNGWYTSANYNTTTYLTGSGVTLPVELTLFEAKKYNDDVLLSWHTASEINNKGFTIERSADGISWADAGFVKGNGTTSRNINYQFADRMAFTSGVEVLSYRLRQVDYNGQTAYSRVVVVNDKKQIENVSFAVAPNPFVSAFRISYQTSTAAPLYYSITGLNGVTFKQHDELTTASNGDFFVDGLDDLPNGVYVLHIKYLNQTYRYKLVKNR
jgi:endonuclease I